VETNEPLYFRRKKAFTPVLLKLSCKYNNPAYTAVFNSKFHSVFERKPTQLPPLAIRVSADLQTVGFKKSDVITSSIPTTPPWLLTRPVVNFTLHCSDESNTPPEMFKRRFYELYHKYKNYYRIFTDGSNDGNCVAAAVVHRDNTKGPFIATQLNSTRRRVELSCVAIDTLTDATQLSPTIGNATDPVEQRTANQREADQSCFCSQCCIVMCDIPTSDVHFLRNVF